MLENNLIILDVPKGKVICGGKSEYLTMVEHVILYDLFNLAKPLKFNDFCLRLSKLGFTENTFRVQLSRLRKKLPEAAILTIWGKRGLMLNRDRYKFEVRL